MKMVMYIKTYLFIINLLTYDYDLSSQSQVPNQNSNGVQSVELLDCDLIIKT